MCLVACGVNKPPGVETPTDAPTVTIEHPNRKLDVLFVLPTFMREWLPDGVRQQLPRFLQTLAADPDGMPDLHVGVVSASMGTGAFSEATRCLPGTAGDEDGRLRIGEWPCTGLAAGARFLTASADGAANNFTGDIGEVASCMLAVPSNGCAISQPLAAAQRSLQKAADASDPDNGGFLRADATLAVIIVSNVDDCSMPRDSTLFDPTVGAPDDPAGLGLVGSYRCAEFGHLCDGQPPPHVASGSVSLEHCVPAEDRGRLTPVAQFVDFFRGLKPGRPDRVIVSALAGTTYSYVVELDPRGPWVDGKQVWPRLGFSCLDTPFPTWATPGIRVERLAHQLGGLVPSPCQVDYGLQMEAFATVIRHGVENDACLPETVLAVTDGGVPQCRAIERTVDSSGRPRARELPACTPARDILPCWDLVATPNDSYCRVSARACYDAACSRDALPADTSVAVHCPAAADQ